MRTTRAPSSQMSRSRSCPRTSNSAASCSRSSCIQPTARAGSERIITRNGESNIALIDAERLDNCLGLERERIHQLLIDDTRRGLADIAAWRTQDADAGIAALQARCAGAPPFGTKGKVKNSGTARIRHALTPELGHGEPDGA